VTSATEESRRTAFTAAYQMGDQGRELFVWLAGQDLPAARRAAVLSLYLRWRRDRAYVFDLMDQISREVGLPPIWRKGRVLRFLGDLSITIYINHPGDQEVIARTSALWQRILRRRLRLQQLLFLVRAPIIGHLQAILAGRTLRTAVLADLQDVNVFFRQTAEQRARFLRTAPLVDPRASIGSAQQQDDLVGLLESPIYLHRILAALVIAIHAVVEPAATARLVDDLRPRLDGQGLLWATLAYTVPLPDTPDSWVEQLESLTDELVERYRDAYFGADGGIVSQFDIALLPLGLAYGKRGRGMPRFEAMIERGLREDRPLAMRLIRGLGAVGVYYPQAVFETLRGCVADLEATDTADAFVDALAAMRPLHFDTVDLFLDQIGAPDAIRDRVSRQDGSQLVSRCVMWVGYYNNAVHESVNYPIMRQVLVIDALLALGAAHGPSDFVRAYSLGVLDLLEETDFELMRWAQPDAPG
jgi:hypothetical protein